MPILPTALVLLVTPLVLVLAARAELMPVRRGIDGWFTLHPSLVLVVLGLLCVTMVFFAILLLLAGPVDKFVGGALLAAVSAGGLYAAFGMRTRFNDDGVEHRGLFKAVFVPWPDITSIKYHPLLGPQLMTKKGNFLLPRFFNGFRQLMDEAVTHGIDIPRVFQREIT